MALSTAPAFAIEELTGSQRLVALTGRALPYQGVAFGSRQRTKRTVYGGNPVATIQVLGAEYDNTTIRGMWKDRFLPGQIAVAGAEQIETAEQAVALFEDLARVGNTLRVQWGNVVRVGILVAFVPTWTRTQDVAWEAEFEWSSEDDTAPRAVEQTILTDDEIRTTSTDVDDAVIEDPPNVLPEYRADVKERTDATRVSVGDVFGRLAQVRRAVQVPINQVQAIAASAETIRREVESTLGVLVDQPYTQAQVIDDVIEVLACERWRRTLARADRAMRAAVLRRSRSLARTAVPGAIAIVVMPGESTLRDLSRTYYGTADSWQLIADANGFSSSRVAPGTVVVVPPPAASGGR